MIHRYKTKDALDMGIDRATRHKPGERFSVHTIFSPEEWKRIYNPTIFGKKFKHGVEHLVAESYRDTSNLTWYIRR